jgi:GTPase SAR1 family protein
LGGDSGKLAIIAHSGVGKSALLRQLREDPRLRTKQIVDLDTVLPAWFDPDKADSLDDESSADYWFWAKMSATRTALRQKADIVAGLFAEGELRALLEEKGFSLVVLSVPEHMHRARLENRTKVKGREVPDAERRVKGQRRLEGLGYELIDAGKPVEEVADDVVERLMSRRATRSPRK